MTDFTTGGAKAQNAEIFIGKRLGKYDVLEKLGQGAMGVVLKVKDTLEDVYKAIKMVPPEVAFDKLSFNQLKQEVNASSKISHPNVIKVMGLEEYKGIYFIVMEYVEGETLADKLAESKNRKLPEDEVLDYFKQSCNGLAEAHKRDVIHLDLKPQNIIVTKNGEVKILDFSISYQITKSMTMITGENKSTGTLPYMAPEQLSNKFGRINEQTDIWGLGATMYHLLSGEVPFDSERKILDPEEEPYELEGVSERTKYLILGCLSKNRKDRFNNISEIEKTLSEKELGIKIQNYIENQLKDIEPEVKNEVRQQSMRVNNPKRNTNIKYLWIALLIIILIIIWIVFGGSNKSKVDYARHKLKVTKQVDIQKAGINEKLKKELDLKKKLLLSQKKAEEAKQASLELEKKIKDERDAEKIKQLEKDKNDYNQAIRTDTIKAFENYLNKHPDGKYIFAVKSRINLIKKMKYQNNLNKIKEKSENLIKVKLRAITKKIEKNNIHQSLNKDIINDFEVKVIEGDRVLIDNATGLMWVVSKYKMKFEKAKFWAVRHYGGYYNWRIPTLEEVFSLKNITPSYLQMDSLYDFKIWTGDSEMDSNKIIIFSVSDGRFLSASPSESFHLLSVRTIK